MEEWIIDDAGFNDQQEVDEYTLFLKGIFINQYRLILCIDINGEVDFKVNGCHEYLSSMSIEEGASILRALKKLWEDALNTISIKKVWCYATLSDGRGDARIKLFKRVGFSWDSSGKTLIKQL